MTESDKTENLGILRSKKEENIINIPKRTSLARQTLYSLMKSKKISYDQVLIQSDPISCPQNQKGNN